MRQTEFVMLLESEIQRHRKREKDAIQNGFEIDGKYHEGAAQSLVWALRRFTEYNPKQTEENKQTIEQRNFNQAKVGMAMAEQIAKNHIEP